MPIQRRVLASLLVACAGWVASGRAQSSPHVTALLDRYLRGEFEPVVAELQTIEDFGPLLDRLEAEGPRWIAADGDAARDRRVLTAATLALEAARIGAPAKWKYLGELPPYLKFCDPEGAVPRRLSRLVMWEPPPRLLKWGGALFRAQPPTPSERVWLLAATAVAEYAGDFEFLSSDGLECLYNPEQAIDFVPEALKRFPNEPRLILALAIREEWHRPAKAIELLSGDGLRDVMDAGAEAAVRLGVIHTRQRQDDRALPLFEGVETSTRDPWVLYLARYFKAQIFERKNKPADAERAYRAALAAVPAAQSASTSLAALLSSEGRRQEASALIDAMLSARPRPVDPWRGYAEADYRFWPQLIAMLRAEIRR